MDEEIESCGDLEGCHLSAARMALVFTQQAQSRISSYCYQRYKGPLRLVTYQGSLPYGSIRSSSAYSNVIELDVGHEVGTAFIPWEFAPKANCQHNHRVLYK